MVCMNTETTKTLTNATYCDWLADQLLAQGVSARAWHGTSCHRIYLDGGSRYLEVDTCTDARPFGRKVGAIGVRWDGGPMLMPVRIAMEAIEPLVLRLGATAVVRA